MRWMVKRQVYQFDLPSFPRLMELVCQEFEVTEEEMKGKGKTQWLSDARMAYVVIARFHFKISTIAIGQKLNREHTTILHLINRMADREFLKHPVVARIKRIEKLFKPD